MPIGDIAGVKNPRNLELCHVLAIDLSKHRMAHTSWIVAIIRPLGSGASLSMRTVCKAQEEHGLAKLVEPF
jgi:hypothetical protein